MRVIIFTLLQMVLMVMSAPSTKVTGTTHSPPFSVDCSKPSLTLTNENQTIDGADGCNVTKTADNKIFTLADVCLTKGTVILENINKDNDIVTAVETYNVTCDNDEGVVMRVNSSKVDIKGQSKPPETYTVSPVVDVHKVNLKLLSTDPATGSTYRTVPSEASVHLGQLLYLTLYSEEATKDNTMNVIPLSCEAFSFDHATNATLWQLHKSTKHPTECFSEKQVVKDIFSQKLDTDGVHIYVARIEAFRFRDHQDADIIFSCQVRVCSTEASLCGTDKDAVDQCQTLTQAPGKGTGSGTGSGTKGSVRRRRDTEDDELTHGRVDHVTARLKVIVDNGVTYGGATRTTFTVTSLILTSVAMVIL